MKQPNKIKHITKTTKNGAKILVLNTNPVINPEAEAMLQALHSRSVGGINKHLQVLAKRGADNFMSTYYVGYGHKSIGDLGSASIFIEGVSMLAAKAIQDWPLYSGQEASTRYIDFTKQSFINPLKNKMGEKILENWRTFYLNGLKELQPQLKEKFPRQKNEDEKIYNKAIAARSFDIMRSFLPAGASTNLAWHSNLRQFNDKLTLLRHHPLAEVKEIAEIAEKALAEAFPNSFNFERFEKTENYNKKMAEIYTYFNDKQPTDFQLTTDTIDRQKLKDYEPALRQRPPKTELPKILAECGQVGFKFLLDFGSFRDIQRHRAVTQRMPLLTTDHGFADWYLKEMGDDLAQTAKKVIKSQTTAIKKLTNNPLIKQYYAAMGFNTTNQVTGNLSALVYLIELRSTRFVHPTLRRRAHQMAQVLTELFADHGLVLHLDKNPDRFDIRRGLQDIVIKN
ncbi:MAG: FAD-dependent thymidylate synthase [Patescibacteria group bacterium]